MLARLKPLLIAITAIAALALGGSALAGAATSTTSTSSTGTSPSPHGGPRPGPGFTAADAPGTSGHESAEKVIAGTDAAKARAAAVASVGGAAGAVTSNFTHDGYEVTVTKGDGSKITVRLDSAFKVDQGGGPHAGAPPQG